MMHYIIRRLVLLIPVLLGISIVVFGFIHLIPGDPVITILGDTRYTPEMYLNLKHELGFDKPIYIQYINWLINAFNGNLGRSIFPFGGLSTIRESGDPVIKLIMERLPTTIILTSGAMGIAVLVALPLGVFTASRKDTTLDSIARVVSVLGVSMPIFWLGLLLILFFSLYLHWLPPGGSISEQGIKVLVLPWIALGISQAALVTRMTRSTMLEVLGEDYIRTARGKGLKETAVLYTHALRNALIPVITIVGLQFGGLLGGAVLTETVFNLHGLGRLLVDSVYRRDYPVIQGCVLFIALFFVVVNLLVDLLYSVLDPRVILE
jgi:peptide/nickel transport system permease protein